jgi:hypothetical protein
MLGCTYPKPGSLNERYLNLKTSSAKQKGRLLQQWTRDLILKEFNLSEEDVRSTSMGAQGEDIQFSKAAAERLRISIECKSRDRVAVYGFYDQARENTPAAREPVVVIKQNRRCPLVVIDAEYFFKLLKGVVTCESLESPTK